MTDTDTIHDKDIWQRFQMPAFRDTQAEELFWRNHEEQMYSLRLWFFIVCLALYSAMGLLDLLVGGGQAVAMLWVRGVALALLVVATIRFATSRTRPERAEQSINLAALATVGAQVILLNLAPPDAAHHYQFGLGVIIGLGAVVLMPRFRTASIIVAMAIAAYLVTLTGHSVEMADAIVNTAYNLMIAGAVLVGSFERERLARLQAITSDTLVETNSELRASRIEAFKARDAAITANRSKNHFLANMSHELRTPLNAIIGFSDMIRSETFGPLNHPRYETYIEHIHAGGTLLQANIDDLLDLARLESGKFGWEDERFDLYALIDTAIANCEINAREADVAVFFEPGISTTTIHADRSRLVQALINLMTNAVKFTDRGGKIVVTTAMNAAGDCTIALRDTGCGMSAESLERVRTPFAQAHEDSYSKGKGGLGLGLAIVCGIAERLEGRFELDSEEGVGTTARLVIPASRVCVPDAKVA